MQRAAFFALKQQKNAPHCIFLLGKNHYLAFDLCPRQRKYGTICAPIRTADAFFSDFLLAVLAPVAIFAPALDEKGPLS